MDWCLEIKISTFIIANISTYLNTFFFSPYCDVRSDHTKFQLTFVELCLSSVKLILMYTRNIPVLLSFFEAIFTGNIFYYEVLKIYLTHEYDHTMSEINFKVMGSLFGNELRIFQLNLHSD